MAINWEQELWDSVPRPGYQPPPVLATGHGHTDVIKKGRNVVKRQLPRTSEASVAAPSTHRNGASVFSVERDEDTDATDRLELFRACAAGCESVVKQLLSDGADVNAQDKDGRTALTHAILMGNEGVVDILLSGRPDVNAADDTGRTPRMYASKIGYENVVKQLLSAGANQNAQDKDGRTALTHAILMGNEGVVDILLSGRPDVNAADDTGRTPLMYAPQWGSTRYGCSLIARFCEHDADRALEFEPLVERRRKENLVERLLSAGANVHATDDDGGTALFHAIDFNEESIVELLLSADADVNAVAKDSQTPLIKAAGQKCESIVERLLSAGAILGVKDDNGWTAYDHAIMHNGSDNYVATLLQDCANVDLAGDADSADNGNNNARDDSLSCCPLNFVRWVRRVSGRPPSKARSVPQKQKCGLSVCNAAGSCSCAKFAVANQLRSRLLCV